MWLWAGTAYPGISIPQTKQFKLGTELLELPSVHKLGMIGSDM